MINQTELTHKAAAYGLSVSPFLANSLDQYAEYLVEWNQKFNLTAITEPEEIENKHFIDSLLLAFQPEISGKLVDVGSGAGFPGMVAALYKQEIQVTLMEPTGKRARFLQFVADQLCLSSLLVLNERAEEAARKQWREDFDVATARAVASLPVLCEYCLPLVRVGGWFIAMKGEADEEIEKAHKAIEKLGGNIKEKRNYTLPGGDKRNLILIQKIAPTPPQYPRNSGKIKKSPL